MRRSRVEDVLDVLNEMRYWFFRSGGSADVWQLRQNAVKAVAQRQLLGRFKNLVTAKTTIRDACIRRLKGIENTNDFERMAHAWLNGRSTELRRAVASEIRGDRELLLAANFFGVLPRSAAT